MIVVIDKNLEGFEETYELFSINIPEKFISLDGAFVASNEQLISDNKFHWGALGGWIVGILLIIFIIFQATQFFGKSDISNVKKMIAVFPFENIIKNEDFEWLSDGVARTLTFRLSKVKTLNVIDQLQILKTMQKVQPKGAGMAYDIIARKTAKKMNINLLLSGSYQVYENQIQITAQLVEVESGIIEPLIMEIYPLSDLLLMQNDVANKITTLLKNNSTN